MTTLVKTWVLCPQDSFKTELRFTEAIRLFVLSELIWLIGALAPPAVCLFLVKLLGGSIASLASLPALLYAALHVAIYYYSFGMQSLYLNNRLFASTVYPCCLVSGDGRPRLTRAMMIKSVQLAFLLAAVWILSRLLLSEPAPGIADLSGIKFAIAAVSAIIGAPLFEEILYRGIVYNLFRSTLTISMSERKAHWLAVLISASIFALQHGNLPGFPRLLLMGVAFSMLYKRSGTLLAPMLAHSLANAIVVIILTF